MEWFNQVRRRAWRLWFSLSLLFTIALGILGVIYYDDPIHPANFIFPIVGGVINLTMAHLCLLPVAFAYRVTDQHEGDVLMRNLETFLTHKRSFRRVSICFEHKCVLLRPAYEDSEGARYTTEDVVISVASDAKELRLLIACPARLRPQLIAQLNERLDQQPLLEDATLH